MSDQERENQEKEKMAETSEATEAKEPNQKAAEEAKESKKKTTEVEKTSAAEASKEEETKAPQEKNAEISQGKDAEASQGKKTESTQGKASAQARAKAAAAKKKRAAAKAKEEEKPKEPSKNQPILDKYVQVIKDNIGAEVLEDQYINDLAKEIPTLVVKNEQWFEVAEFLRHNEQLAFDYLSSLHGTDFETHMEVYYNFYSFKEDQSLAVRVKTERDGAKIASVTPLWTGADWPERETYDLLGIEFEGHPNLSRILLTDDWVGHPLRKDYEQHDEEV